MKFHEYLEDHIQFILVCILFLFLQSFILYFLGNHISMIMILDAVWFILFATYYVIDYYHIHKRFKQIENLKDTIDQKYLLHEVIKNPQHHEEMFYKNLLYEGNKAMLEQVSKVRREREAYQEYIEQWVHEIKTPIAAMKLWCENQQVDRKRDLLQQLERTEHYVEQALYYARSENVNNDFHVHEVDLSNCIHESLLNNKYLCMNAHVQLDIPHTSYYVYTDEKWITFILDQIIENAVKYRNENQPKITISVTETNEFSRLIIEDNGKGITSSDMPRVFDKGFTGENGRTANQHATGIGLYLCKQLCEALSVDLQMESKRGAYTKVMLTFHAKVTKM